MIYEPIEATVYGRNENRVKPLFVQHLPLKEGNTLDTDDESPQLFIVGTDLIYYVDGNFYTAATGDSTPSRFGVSGEDDTAAEARNMDMVDNQFFISNSSNLNFSTRDLGGAPSTDDVYFGFHSNPLTGGGFAGMYADRGYVPTSRGTTLRCYFDKILTSFTDVSGIPDDEYYLPISVNGVFADAAHNITIPAGGSAITTVETTADLSLLSGATYDYVVLHTISFASGADVYNDKNGLYQFDAVTGDYAATGGGYWKRVVPAFKVDSGGIYHAQKRIHSWMADSAGASASKPPIHIFLRNDDGEGVNSAWGGMIRGSAYGGAINFVNDFFNSANRKLQLGLVDNSDIFYNMLEMHYAGGGNTIIASYPIVPPSTGTQTIGNSALHFSGGFFDSIVLGYVTKTAAYTTVGTDYAIDASASGGAFSITLGSGLATGKIQLVRKTDSGSNIVTVAGTINGVSGYSLSAQYQFIQVMFNGTSWNIIAAGIVSGGTPNLSSVLTVSNKADNQVRLENTPSPSTHWGPVSTRGLTFNSIISGAEIGAGGMSETGNHSVSTAGELRLGMGTGVYYNWELIGNYYHLFHVMFAVYSHDKASKYSGTALYSATWDGTLSAPSLSSVTLVEHEKTGIFATGTTVSAINSSPVGTPASCVVGLKISNASISGTLSNANSVSGYGIVHAANIIPL